MSIKRLVLALGLVVSVAQATSTPTPAPAPSPTPTPTPVTTTTTFAAPVTDALQGYHPAGSMALTVGNDDQWSEGDYFTIDQGTDIEENNTIVGKGSIVLKTPTKFDHEKYAVIKKLPAKSTTKGSATTATTKATTTVKPTTEKATTTTTAAEETTTAGGSTNGGGGSTNGEATTTTTTTQVSTTTTSTVPMVTTVYVAEVDGTKWGPTLATELKKAAAAGANVSEANANVVVKSIIVGAGYVVDDALTLDQIKNGLAEALLVTTDQVAVASGRRLIEARDAVSGRRLGQTVKADITMTAKPGENLAATAVAVKTKAADTEALGKSFSKQAKKQVAETTVSAIKTKMNVEVQLQTTAEKAGELVDTEKMNKAMGEAVAGTAKTINPPIVLTTTMAGTVTPGGTQTVTPVVKSAVHKGQLQVGVPIPLSIGLIVSAATILGAFGLMWRRSYQNHPGYTSLIQVEKDDVVDTEFALE